MTHAIEVERDYSQLSRRDGILAGRTAQLDILAHELLCGRCVDSARLLALSLPDDVEHAVCMEVDLGGGKGHESDVLSSRGHECRRSDEVAPAWDETIYAKPILTLS